MNNENTENTNETIWHKINDENNINGVVVHNTAITSEDYNEFAGKFAESAISVNQDLLSELALNGNLMVNPSLFNGITGEAISKLNTNSTISYSKEYYESEIKKLKDEIAELIDLKIKVLPPFSSGFYAVEFNDNLGKREKSEIINLLCEKIDKRYNNENIVLFGIKKISDVSSTTSEEIENEIKRLEELKDLRDDAKWTC